MKTIKNETEIKKIQELHANVTKTCEKHPNGQKWCDVCWEHKIYRLALSSLLARLKYKNECSDIEITKRMIQSIKQGYGANCETKDYEDFPELDKPSSTEGRCGSCVASEIIDWLEDRIKLIKGEF